MQSPLVKGLIKLMNYVFMWIGFSLLIGTLIFSLTPYDENNELALSNILIESLAIAIPVLIASLFASRFLDQRRWSSLGLRFYPKAGTEIFIGLLMGAGILFSLWAIDALWHLLAGGEPLAFPEIKASGAQMLSFGILMLAVAVSEELLVRGYPLQVLIRYMGILPAVILTSVIFGALHITGDVWNAAVVVLDTGFSGILFALTYLKTRALWMPIAFHFANNFMISIFEEVNLDQINIIADGLSQDAFFGWWLVNFPVYLILIFLIARWKYQPDAIMERLFQQHVATIPPISRPQTLGKDASIDLPESEDSEENNKTI